jgi:hypothetical protein
MPASTPRLTTASMVMPGSNERRLGAASSITESPMAVMPALEAMPAVAKGNGRVGAAGKDRLGVGMGVERSAGVGGRGLGVGLELGEGGSTMGDASGIDGDGEGAGRLGDGAAAVVREALHPVAASRMARPAVAIRFVNGAPLR